MKRIIFFSLFFPSVNTSVIIFCYYRRTYRQIKNYRRSIFICDSVGKLIANEMIVQISTENSVGKYKNSGNDFLKYKKTILVVDLLLLLLMVMKIVFSHEFSTFYGKV
jgi:hypothetical protein